MNNKLNHNNKLEKNETYDYNFLNRYFILGTFFLILQILVLYRNYFISEAISIYFFCNHILIILSIGFYLKNIKVINAIICVGLIPQFMWLIDFFSSLLGFNLFGYSQYIFNQSLIMGLITFLIHISTFVALVFTLNEEKIHFKSLIYASSYVVLIYFLTIVFTPVENDINCIYNACNISWLNFNYYTYLWIPLTILIIIIPTFLLIRKLEKMILFEKIKNKLKMKRLKK